MACTPHPAREQREDQQRRREVGVDDCGCADASDDVLERLAVGDEVLDAVGDRSVRDARQKDADRPPPHDATLQSHGEPDGASQRRRRRRGPRSRRDHPRAEVAPRGERRPYRGKGRGQCDAQDQRPPQVSAVGTRLLGEADRRQPRERAVAHVSDRPHDEREAEHPAGYPGDDARVLGHLSGDQRDADEEEAERGERRAQHQRAHRRELEGNEADRNEGADSDVHRQDDPHRGRDRRVTTDGHRPHELEPAAVFLTSSQPAHHQEAHQTHDGQTDRTDLERDLSPDRVQRDVGTVEHERGRVVTRCGGGLVEVSLGRVQADRARRADDDHGDDRQDPHPDPNSIAPGDHPRQRARSGECDHDSSTWGRSRASSSP